MGVNNIPVARLSEAGVPVFNTPGANANAVKELVLAGLLMAARNVLPALRFVHGLDVEGEALERAVEEGKRQFDGFELPGRGARGRRPRGGWGSGSRMPPGRSAWRSSATTPQLTLTRAWELSSEVRPAGSLEELLGRADAVSLHVPLVDATRNLVSAERLGRFRGRVVLLNFSRAEVVDEEAVRAGLDSGRILAYVTDFPSPAFRGDNRANPASPPRGVHPRGPRELRDRGPPSGCGGFLEDGNVEGSVNFPDAAMPRNGAARLAIANRNIPNVLSRISSALGEAGHNIVDMLNKSRDTIRLHPRGRGTVHRAGGARAGRRHPGDPLAPGDRIGAPIGIGIGLGTGTGQVIERLCVVGVGLIGGSLARRALRRAGAVGEVVGTSRREETPAPRA